MSKYLKLFETHAEYEAYSGVGEMLLPNVSYCKDNNEVHYNPLLHETRLIAKFNVTDTDNPTEICYSDAAYLFTEIEIDGVVQPSVEYRYTFDTTGEHIVKYTLGDTTSIGNNAFYDCIGLTSIDIPNSVTSIGKAAFYVCTGLTSVTIPNSVTSIGQDAFRGCSGLTSVTIGNSVTSIGDLAFSGCSGLTSVTIGNSVTSIGNSAFRECSGLTSVTIGNSVTSIGYGVFFGCSGLTEINVDENNSTYSSIDGVVFNKSQTELVLCPTGKQGAYTIPNSVTSIGNSAFRECSGLTSVTIGNSVTRIGQFAFSGCSGLTSVTIGNSVTSIGDHAFSGCSGLTSVTIGNSVTSIGDHAFRECSGLTSVTIGNSVTRIGHGVFFGCSGLTGIVIEATTPTVLGYNAFGDTNDCPIYVPSESVEAYKAASGWSDYASRIQAITA